MIRQGTHSARSLIEAARELRARRTAATTALWTMLRGRALRGMKFRREHQIENFIVDFYCLELKLIVKCDGAGHLEPGGALYDEYRTARLQKVGMTVLRFENEDLVMNRQIVLTQIARTIDALLELANRADSR